MKNRIRKLRWGLYSVGLVAIAGTAVAFLSPTPTRATQETASRPAQEAIVASVSMSGQGATLTLTLASGAIRTFRLETGKLWLDGIERATFEPGGALDAAWRDLLRSPAVFSAEDIAGALRDWTPPAGADQRAGEILERALDAAIADEALGEALPALDQGVAAEAPKVGISIAPGRLSFEELGGQLQRLRESLERLGDEAAEAHESLALVVHDSYAIPAGQTIEGNLALLDGELRLSGTVSGDVLVLDGTLVLEPDALIEGDVLQVGGDVTQRGGRIDGELLSMVSLHPRPEARALAPVPDVRVRAAPHVRVVRNGPRGFFGSVARNVERAVGGLGTTLGWFIGLGLAGLGLVYFQRPRLETVADTARNNVARCFAVGLAGEVLFFPVSLVLVVAIITWLLIPFYAIAVALALVGGYLAVAHALGEIFAARRFRSELLERLRHANSYYYVLSGLALLLLPFAAEAILWVFGGPLSFLRGLAAFAGGLLTWAAITLGFGAVILTRAGTRTEYSSGSAVFSHAPFASKREDVA
jgi:hypothetical protein